MNVILLYHALASVQWMHYPDWHRLKPQIITEIED